MARISKEYRAKPPKSKCGSHGAALIMLPACIAFAACEPQENASIPGVQPRTVREIPANPAPAPKSPLYPPAPPLPDAPDTLKIAVISDINSGYGTIGYSSQVKAAVRDIVEKGFDFVVSPGDLVAGQKPGLDYDRMWKAFHFEVGDVFFDNNLEFIFAPGNHDASAYPSYHIERDAFARAFKNRRPRSPLFAGSQFPFYYGVTVRGVRVIALDITRPLREDDPQLDWLESILSSAPPPRATLVLGHLPLAPIQFSQFWEVAASARLLKILQNTPNTIYISGHHHAFYPGHIGELRTLSAPALGAGPRGLVGAAPAPGYVQIVLPPQGPATVTALVAPDFDSMIDTASLPHRIFNTEREDVGIAEYIVEMADRAAQSETP